MDPKQLSTVSSTRAGYGQAMLELGGHKKIVALSADLTESNQLTKFSEKYPQQFFQCGVAEQNMISLAVGMALEGLIPFASSFGVFVPMRCLDQIRIAVCYTKANVKLASTHCGLATGEDGPTHQALEDVSALRALPGMTIIEPCDYEQALKATKAAAAWKGPVYLRLHRAKFASLTTNHTPFKIGEAQILQKGENLTIIGAGPLLQEAFKLKLNFKPEIINCHTIKPLDEKTILRSARKTGRVLVLQDHQIKGGLGSAVAELLAEKYHVPLKIVGVKDRFAESGTAQQLWEKYGLSVQGIAEELKSFKL